MMTDQEIILTTYRNDSDDRGRDKDKTQILVEPLKFRLAHFLLAFPEIAASRRPTA
jgi:hypothetical protein